MKLKSFCVPYMTDERMTYAANYLVELGYELTDDINEADFVVLPIPAKAYMFENLDNTKIFYGAGNYIGYDYNADEAFLLENAYLTCEGAIALLKENSDKAIYNSKILITGFGRIASALQKALQALGGRVTVCCRSEADRVKALHSGAEVITFNDLKNNSDYEFVFNTVPHLVFTKIELDALNNNAIIFDIASFPGGVDTHYANSRGIKLINAKALPARYSKKTAGQLIAKSVDKLIKEDLM